MVDRDDKWSDSSGFDDDVSNDDDGDTDNDDDGAADDDDGTDDGDDGTNDDDSDTDDDDDVTLEHSTSNNVSPRSKYGTDSSAVMTSERRRQNTTQRSVYSS